MPRIRCGRCGKEAKALYVREYRLVADGFDPNDEKYKARWLRIGYICENCGHVEIKGQEYVKKAWVEKILKVLHR